MRAQLFTRSARLLTVIILAFQLIPLLAVSGAPANKQRFGKITGRVMDINQARVSRAWVLVDGPEARERLVTNDKGEFEISVPPGRYDIAIEANGFRPFLSNRLEVRAGKTQTIRIQLEVPAPIMPAPARTPVVPRFSNYA